MRILLSVLTVLGAFEAPLSAQTPLPPGIPSECQVVLDDIRKAPADQRDFAIADALKLKQGATCYARLFVLSSSVTSAGFASFLRKLEAVRTDKQAGSSSGAGGGTNLASKGTSAKVLSVAAEYGALTESVNQQVVTVQGSLDSPFAMLVRKNLVPYCLETSKNDKDCLHESLFSVLRRFSYGVSFNTNQNNQTVTGTASGQPSGAAQPVTFTAKSNQISSWNARIVLVNKRDDVSKDFQKRWNDSLVQAGVATTTPPAAGKTAATTPPAAAKTAATTPPAAGAATPSAQPLSDAAKATIKPLEDLIKAAQLPAATYNPWYTAAFEALRSADLKTPGALESTWKQHVDRYLDLVEKNNPKVNEAAVAFIQAMSLYDFEQRSFVEAVANKPVLTLEYTNNRPIGQSSSSGPA